MLQCYWVEKGRVLEFEQGPHEMTEGSMVICDDRRFMVSKILSDSTVEVIPDPFFANPSPKGDLPVWRILGILGLLFILVKLL